MGVGACVVSNEPAGLKDALIQERINGVSWADIAVKYNFGSPSGARNAFKKITGITDFKIKGKELKAMVDNNLLDDLKKAVPKKPKTPASGQPWPSPANTAAAAEGPMGGAASTSYRVGIVGEDVSKALSEMYPGQWTKLTVDMGDEYKYSGVLQKQATTNADLEMVKLTKEHGFDQVNAIIQDLNAGKFYSEIVAKHGVSFAEVDTIYWADAVWKSSSSLSGVWDAYKLKPTSENGFKAVQDLVWNMKKIGTSSDKISVYTSIDQNVVDLILENKWQLPDKGSKTYIGQGSSNFGTAAKPLAPDSSQTVVKLIGESNNFSNMTQAQADEWVEELGTDLKADEFVYYRRYTGSFYSEVNGALRKSTYLDDPDSETAKAIAAMKKGMKPIPKDVTLRRGVGSEAFPLGPPKVGDAYSDGGFMSTSFGDREAFSGKAYTLVIDAPKGTLARPLHKMSNFKSENEILLNAGTDFIVTGVKGKIVYLKVVL